MDDIIDLLKIKIEKAKRELPAETADAIAAVDWKAVILGMRTSKGYSFEQLGDLELETELLLCGLSSPQDYPKELEKRMGISKADADELVNEMNKLVFQKIKEEMIKNTERKKMFAEKSANKTTEEKKETQILDSAGIKVAEPDLPARTMNLSHGELTEDRAEILEKIERPEAVRPVAGSGASEEIHPMLTQKLASSFQTPTVNTEHTLENITKSGSANENTGNNSEIKTPKIDPYREIPE